MSEQQIALLEAEARRNPRLASALRLARTPHEVELLARDHGVPFTSSSFAPDPSSDTDLCDSDLEIMASNTSYSKNCPTHRTCGAASPCVRTC